MSMRKAINDMCKSCIYDPTEPGTWRKQVQDCQISGCALYAYRPKSGYGGKEAKLAAKRDREGAQVATS